MSTESKPSVLQSFGAILGYSAIIRNSLAKARKERQMGNMLVDAALKQVERDTEKVQEAISHSTTEHYRKAVVKRAIASVEALKASLKTL